VASATGHVAKHFFNSDFFRTLTVQGPWATNEYFLGLGREGDMARRRGAEGGERRPE